MKYSKMVGKKLCECGCGEETNIIKKTIRKKGVIKGEYNRFVLGHHLKGKKKSQNQKDEMAKTRREWYKKNPKKAKEKAQKMQITKILNGTHAGKNNPNYGSGKFMGKPYRGTAWNKGLTKETDERVKAISESQKGEKNHYWKGDKVTKSPLHQWIKKYKLKPLFCEDCKKKPPYDLANISGEYKRDINDFKWICRKCHMIEDERIYNLRGFVYKVALV